MPDEYYYNKTVDEIISELKASHEGLSSEDAKKRQYQYGYNELKEGEKISPVKIFLMQFKSFVIYILFAAVIISMLLQEYIDAIAIIVILVLNGVMGFIQEYRAEKSIEALKKLAKTRAKVLRDGKMIEIDSNELVPGDIIIVEAGDKISCDARLIEASRFKIDESTLTGESVPVRKDIEILEGKKAVADRSNMVFSGTLSAAGTAKAICIGTGMNTEIGKIAENISNHEDKQTPLQRDLDNLGKFLGYFVIAICVIIFIVGIWGNAHAIELLMSGSWGAFFLEVKELFLTAVALAVAAVPEGLAIVVTISLAIGVNMMVKKNALVRKLPSVETLGCTTVICSDKTGTLTYNQMTVKKLFANMKEYELSGDGYSIDGDITINGKRADSKDFELMLKAGCLNNNASIADGKVVGDPTEGCLIVSCAKAGMDSSKDLNAYFERIDELPFDSDRKMMSTLHKIKGKNEKVMFTKGAPESILKICTKIMIDGKIRKITDKDKKLLFSKNIEFASNALRVLGFAFKEVRVGKSGSSDGSGFDEKNLVFLGLQAMIDPPRKEVAVSIERCHKAGIRVVMITGDHALTASAIGKEIGITGKKAISGDEIDKIDLDKEIDNINIFARVSPEHKMKIIDALQRGGNVVAMTGDGVNDAPALKKADIGIAMGISGTDVAKEASEMILTDDNFNSIVNAVEQGRGIYRNIKKFVNYMLSSNFAEVLVLFLAMLIGFKYMGVKVLPLAALQILWLNLVTDSLPALALGVDPVSPTVMQEKPRNTKAKIIDRQMIANILFVGVLISGAVLGLFAWALKNYDLVTAQTIALTLLVLLEVARAQMVRQQYNLGLFTNKWLLGALALTMILQLGLIYFSPMMKMIFGMVIVNPFKVVPLGIEVWVIMIVITVVIYAIAVGFSKTLDRIVPD